MEHRLYHIKEVAFYLNVPVSTVYSWVSRKKIPFIKIGKLVKFDMLQVNEWLQGKTNCELIHQDGI